MATVGARFLGFKDIYNEDLADYRARQLLSRALNVGRVVAFIGSGVSINYGYIGWDKFVRVTLIKTLRTFRSMLSNETKELLKYYIRSVSSKSNDLKGRLGKGEKYLLALNLCEMIYEKYGVIEDFKANIAKLFKNPKKDTENLDPILEIIQSLKIRRFITTNYDHAIEDSINRYREGYGNMSTINFDPSHPERLLEFSIGVPGFDYKVFHLHGSYDSPKTMIVTERDYQKKYYGEDIYSTYYKAALKVLFNGNAILFMGLGMGEHDLLRPLRQFVSNRDPDSQETPIFALMKRPNNKEEAQEYRSFLYSRYAVKCIYYDSDYGDNIQPVISGLSCTNSKSQSFNKNNESFYFCNEIPKIGNEWTDWWNSWKRIPPLRIPNYIKKYGNAEVKENISHNFVFNQKQLENDIYEKLEINTCSNNNTILNLFKRSCNISRKRKILLLVGGDGSGKGFIINGFLNKKLGDHEFFEKYKYIHYSNTHFSNEALSLYLAADMFCARQNSVVMTSEKNLAINLRKGLKDPDKLIIINGLEKLLVQIQPEELERFESEYPRSFPVGHAANWDTKLLFRVLKNAVRSKGADIIIASSVIPLDLVGPDIRPTYLKSGSLKSFQSMFYEIITPNSSYSHEEMKGTITEVIYALGAHTHILSILYKIVLKNKNEKTILAFLKILKSRLTAASEYRRSNIFIKELINYIAESKENKSLGNEIVMHLGMFTTPVSIDILTNSCARERSQNEDPIRYNEEIEDWIESLNEFGIIYCVDSRNSENKRYTIHSIIRKYVQNLLGKQPDITEKQKLLDTGVVNTKGGKDFFHSNYAINTVNISIEKLLDTIEEKIAIKKIDSDSSEVEIEYCRAVFSLMCSTRSTKGLISVPIDTNTRMIGIGLEKHQQNLSRLINYVRDLRGCLDIEKEKSIYKDCGILYPDELSWIYNELGIASFYQGYLHDAYAFFEIVSKIAKYIEYGSKGDRTIDSEINLAVVQLERGRLSSAIQHLNKAETYGNKKIRSDVKARIFGYRALIYHLAANYIQAERGYNKAIEILSDCSDLRNLSIFLRHRGDLKRKIGKHGSAKEDLLLSTSIATAGGHLDLVHYSNAASLLLRHRDGDDISIDLFDSSLRYARQTKLPKLVAEVSLVQAIISFDQKNIPKASQAATTSLNLSLRGGMRLRATVAIIILGRIFKALGFQGAAEEMFYSANRYSDKQGYQHQIQEVEQELMNLHNSKK